MTVQSLALQTGGNAPIAQEGQVEVKMEWFRSLHDVDITCFLVGENGKVPNDDYMVFYNQSADPSRAVQFQQLNDKSVSFQINLDELPSQIEKCVFTATIDGASTFQDVEGCTLVASSEATEIRYDVTDAKDEKALVVAELYRYKGTFKLRGVGRGFNGGLKPLAEAHGVTVEDEELAEVEVKQAPPKINLTKIDLLKKQVVISLQKKNIEHEKARVAVVIDASGSMTNLFSKGTVQRAFERALAVAAYMDDDGVLDVWFFGDRSMRAPSVTENDFEDYVKRTYPAPKFFRGLGVGNNEPAVIKDIMKKYTKEEPRDDMPTYVIFFSDGGIYKDAEISSLLKKASSKNIFWQFIGIGKANYGILQKLDDLPGRVVDNADFFPFDDLDKVSDEELYNRLFNEYPTWLKEVKKRGIIVNQ
ncbi:VWA domain-containing protein [Guptibacillus hwajinpoensis]|uniref:VWA domain-containing protein n=1 Tax=Guptibacillus hwajinpoensis TaxID=208199 RepID=UPI001CFDA02B|nr:VWA domain-containing protein [Pseudalkalibacillus hwajinpoensis]